MKQKQKNSQARQLTPGNFSTLNMETKYLESEANLGYSEFWVSLSHSMKPCLINIKKLNNKGCFMVDIIRNVGSCGQGLGSQVLLHTQEDPYLDF